MNSKQLEARIAELTFRQKKHKPGLFSTSDETRSTAAAVQNGMYWGQMALGLFRKLTNYHYSPKKRIKKAAITLAVVVGIHLLRKAMQAKSARQS